MQGWPVLPFFRRRLIRGFFIGTQQRTDIPKPTGATHIQLNEHGIDIVTAITVVVDRSPVGMDIHPVSCHTVQDDRSGGSRRGVKVQNAQGPGEDARDRYREESEIFDKKAAGIVSGIVQQWIGDTGVSVTGHVRCMVECTGYP